MNKTPTLDEILDNFYEASRGLVSIPIKPHIDAKSQIIKLIEGIVSGSYREAIKHCDRDELTSTGADYMMDAIEAKLKALASDNRGSDE